MKVNFQTHELSSCTQLRCILVIVFIPHNTPDPSCQRNNETFVLCLVYVCSIICKLFVKLGPVAEYCFVELSWGVIWSLALCGGILQRLCPWQKVFSLKYSYGRCQQCVLLTLLLGRSVSSEWQWCRPNSILFLTISLSITTESKSSISYLDIILLLSNY